MSTLHVHIKAIIQSADGKIIQQDGPEEIHKVFIDSRQSYCNKNDLFIAIKGERNDGHNYIEELYHRGVRNFIVSKKIDPLPGTTIILVSNSIDALQRIAADYRSNFNIPVIGITGSNGKTVVKEWLFQLLQHNYKIERSPRSYNSQVGVPLSVLQLNENTELGIFEAGISKVGEMDKLQKVIYPTIGILTNIGNAHLENFKNREQLAAEKLKLFKNADTLIYNADYEVFRDKFKGKSISWSVRTDADYKVSYTVGEKQSKILLRSKQGEQTYDLPFVDEASLENASHCIVCCLHLGLPTSTIQKGLKNLSTLSMRLEQKQGANNCTLINDSYNNDLNALQIALNFAVQQNKHKQLFLVLSDIQQAGKDAGELYAQVAEMIRQKKVDTFFGIGPVLCSNQHLFDQVESRFFESTEALIDHFYRERPENATILLKGARSFRFEQIDKVLEQQHHDTVLEINLNAIQENYNYFKSLLKRETKIMVMVKAMTYGSGTFEIARLLQHLQADYLAVAYADEGIALRKAGILLPIMVMNTEQNNFEALIKNKLEPEIFSLDQLKSFVKALEIHQFFVDAGEAYPIHLKVETGMHRLGFNEKELEELLSYLKKMKGIKVMSIFTHLAAADEPIHDYFTKEQMDRFDKLSAKIESILGYTTIKHVLNTSGILRFPGAQKQMVRLGIGLYGYALNEGYRKHLRPSAILKSTISQIKEVEKGESIGYGRSAVLEKAKRIAVVPIGYADGLNRLLSNGKWSFTVNGKQAPIVGKVCMDMCMIDVSNMDVRPGDSVVVFDAKNSIYQLAEACGTIPYEILTSISPRVKRVFYQE